MRALALSFGYAGALPFVAGLIFILFNIEDRHVDVVSMVLISQYAYGLLILSFICGMHWILAIKNANTQHMIVTIFMTLLCYGSVMLFLIMTHSSAATGAVFLSVILFWLLYLMDLKFIAHTDVFYEYLPFRRNLTLLVTTTLLFSGIYA